MMKNVTRNWSGYWIRGSEDPAPYLKKTFELASVPRKAQVHLCGLGWHELYVNGVKADDRLLAPTISQFDRRVRYITYDVKKLLKRGRNAIAVLLGNGLYNPKTDTTWNFPHSPWMDAPKMLCDVEFDGKIAFSSDNTWKNIPSPIVFNQFRSGEHYDAKKEIPGCLLANFDDSAYGNAWYCNPPGGEIVKEEQDPCRVCEVIEGKRFDLAPNCVIFDFGKNVTGWVEITVEGKDGLQLEYAEQVLSNGDITKENISKFVFDKAGFQTDRYWLRADGKPEVWHPHFVYHGFRYCRAQLWGSAKILGMKAHFIHTDFPRIGSFSCSDELVNKLYNCAILSYLGNFVGIPTDCPHREKNGWTGDAQLAMEVGLMNFDCKRAVRGFLQTFIDTQRPSGQLPGIAPSAGWGYNWGSGPAWDIYLFEAPYRVWLYTGDESLLLESLPAMEKYLEYCRGMAHEGGLVSFGLGDWCVHNKATETPQELTSSGYYYHAAKIMSRYKPEFARVAAQIAKAINRKYAHADGTYANGDSTGMACALYFGFAKNPVKTAAKLAEHVRETNYAQGFGILGSKYIFRALTDYGYAEDAFKLLTVRSYPSFAHWVEKLGATTLHENWGSNSSLNHIMFGDFAAYLMQYVGGIRPLESAPGFRHFELKPYFISALDHAETEHESPFGMIRSSWKRRKGKICYRAEIPAGSTADVILGGKTFKNCTGTFEKVL